MAWETNMYMYAKILINFITNRIHLIHEVATLRAPVGEVDQHCSSHQEQEREPQGERIAQKVLQYGRLHACWLDHMALRYDIIRKAKVKKVREDQREGNRWCKPTGSLLNRRVDHNSY